MHSRHIEESAGGSGSIGIARGRRLGENVTSDDASDVGAGDGGVSDTEAGDGWASEAAACDADVSIGWSGGRTPAAVSRDGASDAASGNRTSGEDIVGHPFLVLGGLESLGLEVEHRAVAPSAIHQIVVRANLHHPAVFEHADAVGVADR